MARPQYESEQDLANEREIVALVRESWRCDGSRKLCKYKYGIDYSLHRGRSIPAFAEIKDRPTLSFNHTDGYYLSVEKAFKGRRLTMVTGKPCFLVVRFRDGIVRWTDMNGLVSPQVIDGGRVDRGDPLDLEPIIIYPWDVFKELQRGEHACDVTTVRAEASSSAMASSASSALT